MIEKAPYVGWVGDHSSGGLTLRSADEVDSGDICNKIDLGYGIPTPRAMELADKLRAVLEEIVEAQGR